MNCCRRAQMTLILYPAIHLQISTGKPLHGSPRSSRKPSPVEVQDCAESHQQERPRHTKCYQYCFPTRSMWPSSWPVPNPMHRASQMSWEVMPAGWNANPCRCPSGLRIIGGSEAIQRKHVFFHIKITLNNCDVWMFVPQVTIPQRWKEQAGSD